MWRNSSDPEWCFSTSVLYSFTSFLLTYLLLLPPFLISVIYLGFQRWRRHLPSSHSDIFTYNMVVMEMGVLLGLVTFTYNIYIHQDMMLLAVGLHIFSTSTCGNTMFHVLTCLERYLAVVHPISYLRLRQRDGHRIRNVSIICVWLLSAGVLSSMLLMTTFSKLTFSLVFLFIMSSVSIFCTVSVLCALIGPGPRDGGGHKEHIDQSKRRAFHTLIVIMLALLLRFSNFLVLNILGMTLLTVDPCLLLWSLTWLSLPSSLVLPLLFLHRTGGWVCCRPPLLPRVVV